MLFSVVLWSLVGNAAYSELSVANSVKYVRLILPLKMLSRHQSELTVETRWLNLSGDTPRLRGFRTEASVLINTPIHPWAGHHPVFCYHQMKIVEGNTLHGKPSLPPSQTHLHGTSDQTPLCLVWNNYNKRRKKRWLSSINYESETRWKELLTIMLTAALKEAMKRSKTTAASLTLSLYLSVSVFLLYAVWVAHTCTYATWPKVCRHTLSKYFCFLLVWG